MSCKKQFPHKDCWFQPSDLIEPHKENILIVLEIREMRVVDFVLVKQHNPSLLVESMSQIDWSNGFETLILQVYLNLL